MVVVRADHHDLPAQRHGRARHVAHDVADGRAAECRVQHSRGVGGNDEMLEVGAAVAPGFEPGAPERGCDVRPGILQAFGAHAAPFTRVGGEVLLVGALAALHRSERVLLRERRAEQQAGYDHAGILSSRVSIRLLALIPVAVAINLALSAAVDAVNLPLFLDTTGTILATALAGPVVGVTTGVLTSLTNSFRNPTYLPFVAVQVLVALYAWFAARAGLFRDL